MKKFILTEDKLRSLIGVLQEVKWREVARAMLILDNLEELPEEKKEESDVGSTEKDN